MKKNHFLEAADNVLDWLSSTTDESLFDALAKCDDLISYAINHFASIQLLKYNFISADFDRSLYTKLDIADINALSCINVQIAMNDDSYAMAA